MRSAGGGDDDWRVRVSDRVGFDWDDCLVDVQSKLWTPGARSALADVTARGYTPFVHSCRANWDAGRDEIEAMLRDAHLDYEIVPKPAAAFYIDDKNLLYDGNWRATLLPIPPTKRVIKELLAR